MTAAVWLLCSAQLVGSGEAVSLELSSEAAVVRSADHAIVAQAAVKERTTQGAGAGARTHITFDGGELSYHDVYGQARAPRLKGLVAVSGLKCKKP